MTNNKNLKAADVLDRMFNYIRTDNEHKTVAAVLKSNIRFKKEDKSVKAEDSVGFKAVCADIREYADSKGVKAYYSSAIIQFEMKDGEYVRDKFGDRIRHSVGGWLFEPKKDVPYKQDILESLVVKFAQMVADGINDGTYVVEAPKPKQPTKKALMDEIEALKKQLAALQKQLGGYTMRPLLRAYA